jgi:GntR family transcriptional regulator
VSGISQSLLAELTGGRLEPGTRVAPEGELAVRLRVARSTVRAAVDALVDAGYLVRGRGDATVHVAGHAESVQAA